MRIYAEAPSRISLLGGGTDLPSYSEKYGGVCYSIAINLKHRFWLDTKVDKNYLFLPEKGNSKFYEAFLNHFGIKHYQLRCETDAPIETGLGSSATAGACMVAMANRLLGLNLTKDEIAEKVWDIEVNTLGFYGGRQDQYAAVYGGANFFEFKKDIVHVNKTVFLYQKSLLLFDTGLRRENPKLKDNMKILSPEKIKILHEIKSLANLYGSGITLHELLRKGWELKKKSNSVSSDKIDKIYDTGISCGAKAGKLLGSGGGGFMVFWAEPEAQEKIKNALKELGCTWYDFEISESGVTTRILPE